MHGLSMRWWLALAFAAIAASTAGLVGVVLDHRAEAAFERHTHDIAVGDAVNAAAALQRAGGAQAAGMQSIAAREGLSLFIVSRDGALRSSTSSLGTSYAQVPRASAAVAAVVRGQRYVGGTANGGTVIGLRLTALRSVLVAYRPRSDVGQQLAIVRREVLPSALLAGLGGAIVGILVASLITARLRRIARSANRMERGDLSTPLEPGFQDELGMLGLTVERMRVRLAETFEALGYERDRLRKILERLHDGVIAIDADGVVEFTNSAAAQQLGGDGDVVHGLLGGAIGELVESVTASRRPLERRCPAADGRILDLVALPPAQPGGSTVIVIVDVTERERRERAEREFVANAAHELLTPTAAIVSSIGALQDGAKSDPQERDRFLAHIGRQAARLGRLSKAMLVLARAQTGSEPLELAPLPIEPILAEICRDAESERVRFHLECPPGLRVVAQPDLAYQLFSNLMANAARHAASDVRVRAAARGDDAVLISVLDDGPGIAPAERARVFDRFFRADSGHEGGFGLGLAIVRDVAAALGGSVEIRSTNGAGTRVDVVLLGRETSS